MRRTLRTAAEFRGIGLHTGAPVTATIRPAEAGAGLRFRRVDLAGADAWLEARHDAVTDTRLCTRIGDPAGASVGTVEHMMAALAGLGVHDATVEIDGPEAPVMDGSSAVFAARLAQIGFAEQDLPLCAIRIEKPVEVVDGDRVARLLPAERFEMAFEISFADPAIGDQALELDLSGDSFQRELAECRTFGHLAEVDQLRKLGLGRGGGLDNTIVVDRGRVLNPGGLRRPDEFVRHKMLDAVGDLALAGAPIIGRYEGVRAGHEMTNRLLRALFATPAAFSWAEAGAAEVPFGAMQSRAMAAPGRATDTAVAV